MNRKMQDYIVKSKKVFIGLEDSKRTWKICVRCDRREIHYTSMEARYLALLSYIRNKFPQCDVTVIYEAGFKGFGLYEKLISDGINCVVTPPSKVTQEKCNRVKTDKIDARRLATVLEIGDYKTCVVPNKERREDRQISRLLVQVQKEITREKNRIRKFFDFHGYAEDFKPGAWTEEDYQHAREAELPDMLKIARDTYFDILDKLKEVRKTLHKKVMEFAKKDCYKRAVEIISSAPGVGRLTAIRLVLEWGEHLGTRFPTGAALACFSGLTQSEYSTGETVRKGRITGIGRGFIRAWLIQCSWISLKRDPVLLEAFNRITDNTGGSKKKAIVAIARKLVVRIWTCVHKNEPYTMGLVQAY
jgi:transposase